MQADLIAGLTVGVMTVPEALSYARIAGLGIVLFLFSGTALILADTRLAVDLKGTIACSYAAGELMRAQDRGGAIINMSWDHVTAGIAG